MIILHELRQYNTNEQVYMEIRMLINYNFTHSQHVEHTHGNLYIIISSKSTMNYGIATDILELLWEIISH